MSNITLPRAEAEQIRQALVSGKRLYAALFALDAALAEPPAKPEPATREQVFAAYDRNDAIGFWNYCYAWREAERFHGITKEDKT
jgi:hypothetical protein